MRIPLAAVFLACMAEIAFAQGRAATEKAALAYIYSAFVTRADPGVMSKEVKLGPELGTRLGVSSAADGVTVYEKLLALTGSRPFDVRKATAEEVASYGMRRGLDPAKVRPFYVLEVADQKILLQYDLQATHVPFVGQLGLPDPEAPQKVAAVSAETMVAKAAAPEPAKLALRAEFAFDSAELTPEMRATIDAELLPGLKALELRFVEIDGHADRIGAPDYNQRLSEKRADAVRDYLISQGVDPTKIEVSAYGSTQAAGACNEVKGRRALIECLAPSRRVVIQIEGIAISPAQEVRTPR